MLGKQRLRIAQHFELAQRVTVEQFAAEAQRAHRFLGCVAAGGIGQVGELRRRKRVNQRGLPRFLSDVGSANRNSDNIGAAGLDGVARFVEILVLAGADKQSR
jgi:hypothetical protein